MQRFIPAKLSSFSPDLWIQHQPVAPCIFYFSVKICSAWSGVPLHNTHDRTTMNHHTDFLPIFRADPVYRIFKCSAASFPECIRGFSLRERQGSSTVDPLLILEAAGQLPVIFVLYFYKMVNLNENITLKNFFQISKN